MAAVCFAVWRFFERLVIKPQDGMISEGYISVSSKIDDLFMMIQHGSRLITWWSIDEDSKEEQAHLCYTNNIGYSTFCSYPPEMVKEMPKKVLVKEVQRLQLALGEQTKMAKLSQQQCDRLKNDRILCEFALRETSALFCFHVTIMFSANKLLFHSLTCAFSACYQSSF